MDWSIFTWMVGIVGAIVSWSFNESKKRRAKLIEEKEKRYESLIRLVRNFGDASSNAEKGNEFIVEFQLCWMYCPDEIILKGNAFIDSMNSSIEAHNQTRIDKLKGEFILAMRQDLINMHNDFTTSNFDGTSLSYKDFRDVVYRKKQP